MPRTATDEEMSGQTAVLRTVLDRQTHTETAIWARQEGRTIQRHVCLLLRRLNEIRKTNPQAWRDLGILTPLAAPSAPAV